MANPYKSRSWVIVSSTRADSVRKRSKALKLNEVEHWKFQVSLVSGRMVWVDGFGRGGEDALDDAMFCHEFVTRDHVTGVKFVGVEKLVLS